LNEQRLRVHALPRVRQLPAWTFLTRDASGALGSITTYSIVREEAESAAHALVTGREVVCLFLVFDGEVDD
jgi:hypothetical protein